MMGCSQTYYSRLFMKNGGFGSLTWMLWVALAGLPPGAVAVAQDQTAAPVPAVVAAAADPAGAVFDGLADRALAAMRARAEALKVKGVAVVAYVPGQKTDSWLSKMVVVGQLASHSSKTNDPGSNLLAIAYSKASEMADTLKPSGSKVRPPMTGEFGWQGGWIAPGKNGYLIAAFSGGRSADDVQVSKAGVAVLAEGL
jgi:hypothetical protein